jgi:hypothetical protein
MFVTISRGSCTDPFPLGQAEAGERVVREEPKGAHSQPPTPAIRRLATTAVNETGVGGISLTALARGGAPVFLFATDPVSEELDEVQYTLGEGPAIDASASGAPVLISDLEDRSGGVDGRWPVFRGEARRLGVRAFFAFPIRIGVISLGIVDLHRVDPGSLDDAQLARALTLVDSVGNHLLDLGSEVPDEEDSIYPQIVHQAAGMVMVQLGCGIDEALVRLRGAAFAEGTRISTLAAQIVAGHRRMQRQES